MIDYTYMNEYVYIALRLYSGIETPAENSLSHDCYFVFQIHS